MIILSYLIYRYFALEYNLVSIGLIAFVIIAQLAPAFFGAVFYIQYPAGNFGDRTNRVTDLTLLLPFHFIRVATDSIR